MINSKQEKVQKRIQWIYHQGTNQHFFFLLGNVFVLLETEFSLKRNTLVRKQLCTVALLALTDYSTVKKKTKTLEFWAEENYNHSQKKRKKKGKEQ